MRTFGTYRPVNPEENYVVSRAEERADFINRVKQGRYIVIFAPRQTGKTTFFQWALDSLAADTSETYFPIELNFEVYEDYTVSGFYDSLYRRIYEEIKRVFEKRDFVPSETLSQFLENTQLTDHVALLGFRHQCPYSVGIVGVKNVVQLNLNRSILPFNIQDEFTLPNFTLGQVRELLTQYTDEVEQPFVPEVVENIHKQTAGQPVLVNRFAQILTEGDGCFEK